MPMLYHSLTISVLLLLFAIVLFVWRPKSKLNRVCLFMAAVLTSIYFEASAAVLWQGIFIAALLLLVKTDHAKIAFATESIAITLAVYGFFLWRAWANIQQYQEWREQYVFQSMEDRVPLAATKASKSGKLSSTAVAELKKLGSQAHGHGLRERALWTLHSKTMESFINAPGFGAQRMIVRLTKENLEPEKDLVIPQPGSLGDILGGEPVGRGEVEDDATLLRLHRDSVLDFVNPRGFGWVKSRAEVAGFQAHFFRKVPTTERWQVRAVELVGLLLHKEPVAYVTANLPRMEELRTAPTRGLDNFESAGLKKLREGETLHVEHSTTGLRVLGAIRSLDACRDCHGGDGGELLGAFSYALALRKQ